MKAMIPHQSSAILFKETTRTIDPEERISKPSPEQIGQVPSLEAINGFMANPELKATMEKGGVIGMPEVKM